MSVAAEIFVFPCPTCSRNLEPGPSGETRCGTCGWEGTALLFRPLNTQAEEAEEALPDDATCVHHPTKRAVSICEGTGDYVCSLCSVDMNGQTYSLQYVNRNAGKKFTGSFTRHLDRPDRYAAACILVSILFWPLALVFVPLGIYQFIKMIRLRKEDPIFRRVCGPVAATFTVLFLALVSLIPIAIFLALIFAD